MADEHTETQLLEALRSDQRHRWQDGDRIRAEAYVTQHPALQAKPEYALELVYNEVLLREQQGEAPHLDEYLKRFPQLAAQLKPLFEVHQALESGFAGETPDIDSRTQELSPGAQIVAREGLPDVPGYEVLRELGRGGMAVVYAAWQTGLNRLVALKMLLAGEYASTAQRARFRTEAEAVGRLQHPNIVPIYEVGEHDGRLYLSMEYMDGGSLAERLDGTPRPARAAAELVETLARAVHHAHQRGIVHRDLTPSNILLAAEGEGWGERESINPSAAILHPPPSTLHPKIADFGLAKLLVGGGEVQTQTGTVLGTPSYMAPEQALGRNKDIGPAVDVYALGAILYELLTGRPPFKAPSPVETLMQVRSDEPVRPRSLQPCIPVDLETIGLKCLHKEPARRYADALGLADDLRRFLEDRPIQARPTPAPERVRRWCRRNPAVSALAASVTLLLLVLAVGLLGAARRFKRERDRVLEAQRATERELGWSYLAQARAGRRNGQPGRRLDSLDILAKAIHLRSTSSSPDDLPTLRDLRNEMIGCLALADLKPQRRWDEQAQVVPALDLSLYARNDLRGQVSIHQFADDRELFHMAVPSSGRLIMLFSPDTWLLLLAPPKGTPVVWDIPRGEPLAPNPVGGRCVSAAFLSDSRRLAIGQPDGAILVYDLTEAQRIRRLSPANAGPPRIIALHPDGRSLAVCRAGSRTAQVWDLTAERAPVEIPHPQELSALAWCAGGRLLATACDDNRIRLWNVAARAEALILEGHQNSISGLASTPAGDLLASCSFDGTLRLWDVWTGHQVLNTMKWANLPRFSLDGSSLLFEGPADILEQWKLEAGGEHRVLHAARPGSWQNWESGAISPDGRLLVVAMEDGARLWDLGHGQEQAFLPVGSLRRATFAAGGSELITGGESGLLRWPLGADGSAGGEAKQIGPPEPLLQGLIDALCANDDGSLVLARRYGHSEVVRLKRDCPLRMRRTSPARSSGFLSCSSDGRQVARSGWQEYGVTLWDPHGGKRELLPSEPGLSVCFSPEGKELLVSSSRELRLWDVATGQPGLSWPRRSGGGPGTAAFSADGCLLALDTAPGQVQLVNRATGEELALLQDPDQQRNGWMSFTPDGTRLVIVADTAHVVHVWDLQLLRQRLAEFGLDWDLPSLGPPESPADHPLHRLALRTNAEFYYLRGRQADQKQAFSQARDDYQRAIELEPNHGRVCNELAWLYVMGPRELRDPVKALPLALRALSLCPEEHMRANVVNTLGVNYYRLEKFRDAITWLSQSASAQGRDSGAAWDLYFLAMAYHKQGETAEGRRAFERAAQLHKTAVLGPESSRELERIREEAADVLQTTSGPTQWDSQG
jgi:serine/threonine protein kinase/WD40 repeat protein